MKRSEIREAAFMLIFEKLFRPECSCDEIIEAAKETGTFEFYPVPATDEEQKEAETAENKGDPAGAAEVEKLFRGVVSKQEELDEIISGYSNKRQVSRIAKVSLTVLRLAIYEILYCDKVPTNVAISEAVNLTKKYALDPEVKLVNGILGAYSRASAAEKSEDKD